MCQAHRITGKFYVYSTERVNSELKIDALLDLRPSRLSDRVAQLFQRIELLEKIAEFADESYHLFGHLSQRLNNPAVHQLFSELHRSAHHVEKVLHAFCFFGNVVSIYQGRFIVYQKIGKHKIDFLRTLSRICHIVAHFFCTSKFLQELQLIRFGRLEKGFKYAALLSTMGYLLTSISLVWEYHQKKHFHDHADLKIHLGGFFFEAFRMDELLSLCAPYSSYLLKIASIAGMIHAWYLAQQLIPEDQIKIKGQYSIKNLKICPNSKKPTL